MTGRFRVLAVVAAACLIAGCSTAKGTTSGTEKAAVGATPLPERFRREVRVVRVTGEATTGVRITEAAKGGVAGMGRGTQMGAQSGGGGGKEAAVGLPLSALIGAVAGTIAADPRERVEAEESALSEAVIAARVTGRVQAAIVRQIRERSDVSVKAADGGETASGPADAVIEVTADDLQLVGNPREVNPDLAFRMRVTTRLMRADGSPLHAHEQYWGGVRRGRRAWLADKAGALQQEIAVACEAVAERIVDDLFLVLPTNMTLPGGQTPAVRMPPENPRDPSLQPTLRWEPFSPQQLSTQDGLVASGEVRQMTYELRLWNSENSVPMYTREGLAEPGHTIEVTLERQETYRWAVRARMVVNDAPRVTPWSRYWFKTPSQ